MKVKILFFLLLVIVHRVYSQPSNTNISTELFFGGEPYIAVNPTNNQNIVVAWMSLQFSGGFRMAIKTKASFDGGNSWSTPSFLPHFSSTYQSADPTMAFDSSGLLCLAYIDYRITPDSGGTYVARSFDGGLTWDAPTQAFDMYDNPTERTIDRPWLVVDKSATTNAGTLYITTIPAYFNAPPNRPYFKTSSDSGFTWTNLSIVDGIGFLAGNVVAQPMAAPATTKNGNFVGAYLSYMLIQNPLPSFYLATSFDKGQNFSYSNMISDTANALNQNLKSGYRLIANPADSNKMCFFIPNVKYGDADILSLHSNDGGQTWSNWVRVNDDSISNGKDQDLVWADYNEQGNIAVTWRDRRNSSTNGWGADYDFYYAISTDNGQTFSTNQILSSQNIPFDSLITGAGNDFMSCAYFGDTLYTTWGDTRNGKMNIYFAKTIASTNTTVITEIISTNELEFFAFPNPTTNTLTIRFPLSTLHERFNICNVNGQVFYSGTISEQSIAISTTHFPTGVYFIYLTNYSNTKKIKFVKQ